MSLLKPITAGGGGGGEGGSKWTTQTKNGEGMVAGMIIAYEERIDSIIFKSMHNDGTTVYSKEFGHNFNRKSEKIDFDYPHEYITSVSGYYGRYKEDDPVTIRSLTFVTNVRKYGSIGPEVGTCFNLSLKDGIIVGFHVRSGCHIDAIGVFVKHIGSVLKEEVRSSTVPRLSMGKELVMVSASGLGPWGGAGGRPFDDGVFSGIKSISVQRDDDVVRALLIEYDKSGQSVVMKHGSEIGDIIHRIFIDCPKECLLSVSGFYGLFRGHDVIKSLSFQTTKGSYGPFGEELGLFFSSAEVNAKIVGFHGRSGVCLDAIGVVREYLNCSIKPE